MLDGPGSVRVLSEPSWWTLRRTLVVVGGMALVVLAALGWGAFFKDRAEQNRRQFRATFDASPMPAWIVNVRADRCVEVNTEFLSLFGCRRENVEGKPMDICPAWESRSQRKRFFEELAAGGSVRAFEARFRACDGHQLHMLVSAEPIRIEDDACILVIGYDVTERLKLLEQLRQSQKMEAVGQLAAGVAHDFNNLLTVIRGNSELLRLDADLNEDCLKLNEEVDQAADRAANLTRQLLAFSRKQVMRRRGLDLKQIVENADRMLGRLLGETISVTYRPTVEPLPVKADAGLLDQVILNLAVNARDAMNEGGELVLSTRRASVSRDNLPDNPDAVPGVFGVLTVSDTGCGMTEEVRRHVFDPFYTTKEVGKGTGLGLSTVYGIVRQHGGWIDLESEVGKGTSFAVYLPLTDGDVDSDSHELPTDLLGRGTETILVVEDEEPVRPMVCRTLSRYGYTVLEASDGPSAEALWEGGSANVDLVLTDIVMPNGVSGLELANRLRAERADLKVIFMTGYSGDLLEHGHELTVGFDFLPKPFETRELVRILRERLDAPVARS